MRYWVNEMHIDGFRLDLASVGVRNPDGSISADPPLAGEIRAVPELARARHIVEPWDVGLGGYLLGKAFPGQPAWQWNGRFRDDVRKFVRGDAGMVGSLMARLYGSDDLFPDTGPAAYRPYQSVNYVTAHDGFTLYDLVSYNAKRNWANGQNNTDGPADEQSWNCGWEGDEALPAEVLELRKRQIRNFCAILLLSNGTPMIRGGDEALLTQGGNSNPYNQDNATTWFDWNRLRTNQDIFRFFKLMIAFRKAHPSIARSRFWREDVKWYGAGRNVDFSGESRQLAYFLRGSSQADDDLYVMINAHWDPHTFTIHEPGPWLRVVDTSRASPEDIVEPGNEQQLAAGVYPVGPRSVVVLIRPRPRNA
jgi:glycogen operon protein